MQMAPSPAAAAGGCSRMPMSGHHYRCAAAVICPIVLACVFALRLHVMFASAHVALHQTPNVASVLRFG
jgi:hypothetical protein